RPPRRPCQWGRWPPAGAGARWPGPAEAAPARPPTDRPPLARVSAAPGEGGTDVRMTPRFLPTRKWRAVTCRSAVACKYSSTRHLPGLVGPALTRNTSTIDCTRPAPGLRTGTVHAAEPPFEHHLGAVRARSGSAIRPQRGRVVRVGQDPHAVAVALLGKPDQCLDQRGADAAASEALIHAEFVQEHLGALVRMGQLHTRHETGGLSPDVGDAQVMSWLGQELAGPSLARRVIEQLSRVHDRVLVCAADPPELHETSMPPDVSFLLNLPR